MEEENGTVNKTLLYTHRMATSDDQRGVHGSSYPKNESKRIRVLSWNIDGLDETTAEKRTYEICEIIKTINPHVVLLQEVVLDSFAILCKKCPEYRIIPGDITGYFVAMMLKIEDLEFIGKSIFQYPFSILGRHLLTVRCRMKGVPFIFMTSHLESMARFSEDRKIQLGFCFHLMKRKSPNYTVIFGGDMNLRDRELSEMGGIPEGISDVWEMTGSKSNCKFTWDMLLNTNKEFDSGHKPRCRFDRIYLRDSDAKSVSPVHFELVGLEKLRVYKVFPSDHFGLLADFDISC